MSADLTKYYIRYTISFSILKSKTVLPTAAQHVILFNSTGVTGSSVGQPYHHIRDVMSAKSPHIPL